jgi:hypothetical protein
MSFAEALQDFLVCARRCATSGEHGRAGDVQPTDRPVTLLSRKTVEKRLSEAYRKLAIGSRHDLAAALATPSAPSPGQVEPRDVEEVSP